MGLLDFTQFSVGADNIVSINISIFLLVAAIVNLSLREIQPENQTVSMDIDVSAS